MSFIIILPTPAFEAQSDTGLPNFAFCNLPSTFHLQFFGGIAQLVERQLCKLEVRGSNPLASKACKAWRQHLQTGNTSDHFRSVIPLPPVFARSDGVERGCRAVALAKVDTFEL